MQLMRKPWEKVGIPKSPSGAKDALASNDLVPKRDAGFDAPNPNSHVL
jgi:hypothetical protein